MKIMSRLLRWLDYFLMSAGSEKMLANAAGQWEKPLHGGVCQKDEGNKGCVAKYGAGYYGYC